MAHKQTPWFRKSRNAWFVQHHGKQVRLAVGRENRDDAMRAFYRLMAEEKVPVPEEIRVAHVCDLFLDWSEKHHKPETFDWHKTYLEGFCQHKGNGGILVAAIKPIHLTRWVDSHDDWTGAIRTAKQIVKRAFKWAKEEGLIEVNPFASVKLPPIRSRKRLLSVEEQTEILNSIRDKRFRVYLIALLESGARPSEVANLTATQVDLASGLWILNEHKTEEKTGTARIIYLNDRLLELTKTMMGKHPAGVLFPNRLGKAFTRNAIRCQFRRLEERLPHLGRVQAYLFRHRFATTALENGVGVAQVAELLGHKSTEMVMRHYGHLNQRIEHMRKMAAQATASQSFCAFSR